MEKNILETLAIGSEVTSTVVVLDTMIYMESKGFGVFKVEDEDGNEYQIKGGFVSELEKGSTYKVKGTVTVFNRKSEWGSAELRQLTVESYYPVRPVNKTGIIAYLKSVKGVGKKAELIYDHYKEESIGIIKTDPLELTKLKGIGKKSVLKWQEILIAKESMEEITMRLFAYGLSETQSRKLYEKYKEEVINKIESNPYILAREVKGFGFKICDKIAQNMEGFNPLGEFRVQEAISYVLEEAATQGHCFLPSEELYLRTKNVVDILIGKDQMKLYGRRYASTKGVFPHKFAGKEYNVDYNEMMKIMFEMEDAHPFAKNLALGYPIVELPIDIFAKGLEELTNQFRIVICSGNNVNDKTGETEVINMIYLKKYFRAEEECAEFVANLKKGAKKEAWPNAKILDDFCKKEGYVLEEMQKKAVLTFTEVSGGMHILAGSAGTGKTFVSNIVIKVYSELFYRKYKRKLKLLIVAPTGKAAKVISMATQLQCKTIHRALEYDPIEKGFVYNRENLLEADLILADEGSMIDIMLMRDLMEAINENGTKLIVQGDIKQLQSVGAGNVLLDLIASKVLDVVELNVIKRQGKTSNIIVNANRIIEGEPIETGFDELSEEDKAAGKIAGSVVMYRDDIEKIHRDMIASVRRIQFCNKDNLEEIQVLVPQRKGPCGVDYLNYLMQQNFNHTTRKEEIFNKEVFFNMNNQEIRVTLNYKVGDKIIHLKNVNDMDWYEKKVDGSYVVIEDEKCKGITNGECGVIEDIIPIGNDDNEDDKPKLCIVARYDDKYILYSTFDNIDHAYALTIHKSQGSAWRQTITILVMSHYMMLQRNLFYTAYTRARKFGVVIGQERAIKRAIKNQESAKRYTYLAQRIMEKALHC